MQVVAGSARRILLKTPPGLSTRPTSNRIKETLFNILQPRIQGARFLDLFAGSGAMGIEALSRGAVEAVFVEKSRPVCAIIEDNLARTHLKEKARLLQSDVLGALRRLEGENRQFDIVFMDPPYDSGCEEAVLEILTEGGLLAPEALIICEVRMDRKLAGLEDMGLVVTREKEYKNNKHLFLQEKEAR